MWQLHCEEGRVPKNWCFWTVALEKTLESPLNCKEIQPVHSERDQPWDFFGGNDAKAETPVLWLPHGRVDSLEKTLMLGGIGDRRRRGRQRMRRLDGITDSMDMNLSELRGMVMDREAWRPAIHGVARSRTLLSDWTDWTEGSLVCCSSLGHKESYMTEWLYCLINKWDMGLYFNIHSLFCPLLWKWQSTLNIITIYTSIQCNSGTYNEESLVSVKRRWQTEQRLKER